MAQLICKNGFIKLEAHRVCYNHITIITKAESADTALLKAVMLLLQTYLFHGAFCCALFMSAKGKKEGVTEEEREKKE